MRKCDWCKRKDAIVCWVESIGEERCLCDKCRRKTKKASIDKTFLKKYYEEKECPMLIKLPESEDWCNTHEGGLSFYFIVRCDEKRTVCLAGFPITFGYGVDVCLTREFRTSWDKGPKFRIIDAGLLIGSTKKSLCHKNKGYFRPKKKDLTEKGKELYNILEYLYGQGNVKIVTLLDT